jgi:hypothetical protein
MPWYEVPVAAWVEADDEQLALDTVMNLMPVSGQGHAIALMEGGPADQLDEKRISWLTDFVAMLNQASEDVRTGNWITDPAHPDVKFTPAAAAQLIALEAESEPPDVK